MIYRAGLSARRYGVVVGPSSLRIRESRPRFNLPIYASKVRTPCDLGPVATSSVDCNRTVNSLLIVVVVKRARHATRQPIAVLEIGLINRWLTEHDATMKFSNRVNSGLYT